MEKPRWFRYIVLLFFIGIASSGTPAGGQTPGGLTTNFVYRTWNNETGLPQNTVYDMVQDSVGYLWGATEEGLFRFDGSVFTLIDQSSTSRLRSHTFYDLLPAGKDLWASGRDNIVRIHNMVEKIYELGSRVSGGWIRCIEKDQMDRIWIGTSNGRLFYIQDDSIRTAGSWPYGMGGSIECMALTQRGMVIGTSAGVYVMKDIASKPTVLPQLAGIPTTVVIQGAGADLWIGTANNGLYLMRDDTTHYSSLNGLTQNNINSLAIDKDHRLWIGFQSAGYQLMDKGNFITPAQEGHENDGIRSILPAGNFITWLGTNSSGLRQIRPAQITGATSYKDLHLKISLGIYQHPSGEVWVGTAGRGVYRLVNGNSTPYNQSNGLSGNLVLSFTGRDDYIYIGTNNGLDRFNRKTASIDKHYTTRDGLQSNSILSMLTDSRKRIWIATRFGGLQRMDTTGKIIAFPLPLDLGQSNLIALHEDKRGTVWIGTRNSGLLSIDPRDEVKHYDRNTGLAADIIYSFYEDREGDLWIGSDKGLICFTGGRFRLFSIAQGLRFNEIYRILEDPNGFVWVSGNLGLQRIPLSDFTNSKKPGNANYKLRSRLFNASDGMPNSETNGGFYPAGWRLQDGNLWFPTSSGIAVVDDKLINEESNELDIHVQSLRYADQEFYQGDKIRIPPGVFNFEIRYTSLDFAKSSDIRFYYRLKGFSEQWTEAGSRHVAYFSELEPGEYTFEVKSERYGYFSAVASMMFTVQPYFYQTWWFKTGIAALAVLAVLAVFLYLRSSGKRRLREQQKITMAQIHGQEKERQFISAELHDSVNQQLTTAKLFLDFARTNVDMRTELMAKSEKVIQTVISNIRTLCNSLTPPSLKDIGLKEALEDLVHSYSGISKFRINWSFDINPDELSEQLQFTLFRITQEQMQNIVRHSGCKNVWLEYTSSGSQIIVTIRDDGKGFDTKNQRYGLGFENIRNRLILYNGKLEIKSAPGKGCSVLITLPAGR